jgi:regulator of cell morphogenesis and NO signaling
MKNELSSKTLAQIVDENHKAAAILEKYALDFCCKGKRSLQAACEERDLPTETIAEELGLALNSERSPVVDFNKLSLGELADYIVSVHHDHTRQELPQVFYYLQKVSSKHGDRHNELYKIFEKFLELRDEMEMHMQKEEQVLFPRIKELENAIANNQKSTLSIQIPIAVMEDEHEHAGNILKEIRGLSNNYNPPPDACTTYRLSFSALQALEEDLHQHIHLENNILFPRAIKLLEPGQDCQCCMVR